MTVAVSPKSHQNFDGVGADAGVGADDVMRVTAGAIVGAKQRGRGAVGARERVI